MPNIVLTGKLPGVDITDCKRFHRQQVNDALLPELANSKQQVKKELCSPAVLDRDADANAQDTKRDENMSLEQMFGLSMMVTTFNIRHCISQLWILDCCQAF